MGVVYEARDTRLERTVALKISKERFGERFRDEALAVAALNHPHICALFDVGPDYLVMEFVPGKRLQGPLPLSEVLRLAGQIADALEHAHTHGVIHRDLKPSNIFVTRAGVKVLDFGVAKRRSPAVGNDGEHTATDEAALVGSPRYMAPEQILGKDVDERTDVFAFGLVLYEMLTGRRAFDGQGAPGVMAAILEHDPAPISASKARTPAALEQVVLTCLAKDPADRWQSVRELKHALGWAARPGPVRRSAARTWIAVVASVIAATGILLAVAHRRPAVERPVPVRFEIPLPAKATSEDMDIAVSPDGRKIVLQMGFDEVSLLYVRALDSLDLTPVTGSERGFRPFWSPDGRYVAFFGGGMLKKGDLSGGPVQALCRNPGWPGGGTWSPEGVIVWSAGGKLFRIPAGGGEPEPLGALAEGESARYWPRFLPDGRHYLYVSISARPEVQGIYVGSLDSDLRRRIVVTEYSAAYSPSGHLLFVKDEALMAQRFDAESFKLSGELLPVVQQLALFKGAQPAPNAIYSVSSNGVLAWRPRSTLEPTQLTWFDRSGQKLGTLGEPALYFAPMLSPDQRSVAVCRVDPVANMTNRRDLWIFDVARGTSRRFTFDPADECNPVWSPDGSRIAFFSDRRGVREIYQKPVNGSGEDELVLASTGPGLNVEDWSPDGRFLVYNSQTRPRVENDLFLLPMRSAGAREPIIFLDSPALEHMGTIAPNGRWIVYRSGEFGPGEIYVSDLSPQGTRGPGKWQISTGGGWQPRWRQDGKELFYTAGSTLMAVAVKPDAPSFEAGTPRPLFDAPHRPGFVDRFVVTRDGQRFLLNVPLKPAEPVRVLVNWLPEGAPRER